MMLKLLAAAAAAALIAGSANAAAITFTLTSGTPSGDHIVEDFDNPITPGFAITPSGPGQTSPGVFTTGTYQGSLVNDFASPAGDSSIYYAVLGGTNSSATFTSTTDLSALSVEIGTVDSYNTISFYENGTLVQSFTGTQLDPGTPHITDYFNFTDTTGYFNKVVFSSTSDALEFDNIAVAAAPEPSTWALMFAGVAMLGGALRLRRTGRVAQA